MSNRLNIDFNTVSDSYMREHLRKVQDAINSIPAQTDTTPTGTTSQFSGSAPPSGYIRTDGKAYRRADQPGLYAVIGTKYGNGASEGFAPGIAFQVPKDSDFSFATGKGMIKT